jgi:transposase InsO family protein
MAALVRRRSPSLWRHFRTRTEARMAVFDDLEGLLQPHRRHSALGQLSPTNYERSHLPRYASAQP